MKILNIICAVDLTQKLTLTMSACALAINSLVAWQTYRGGRVNEATKRAIITVDSARMTTLQRGGGEILLTLENSGRHLVRTSRSNIWQESFNREEDAKVATLKHTTVATARLRFLFLAAKIWRHAGRVGVSYSDHYAEQGIFRRLMDRLRAITNEGARFRPVLAMALRE